MKEQIVLKGFLRFYLFTNFYYGTIAKVHTYSLPIFFYGVPNYDFIKKTLAGHAMYVI